MFQKFAVKLTKQLYATCAVLGCIVILKDHALQQRTFGPLEQHLGGRRLHSNGEMEMAIREWF
jgi:hypothetical protein